MDVTPPLPPDILGKVLRHVLGEVVCISLNVVEALSSDCLVHLLVTIELVSHSSEQASSILSHLLDQVPFPPHDPLEPEVFVPPLFLREVLPHVAVLVLTVVPLLLLLLLLLPLGYGTGHSGG